MPKLIDLTGQRFGRLTVVDRGENADSGQPRWHCQCDCGNSVVVLGQSLRTGQTKSCGCLHREIVSSMDTKHGQVSSRLYRIWKDMRRRCNALTASKYSNYGGRGINVCSEWDNDFRTFYAWALANGYEDDLTIDRIDVDGPYSPENCRWSTYEAQANNKTNNTLYTCFGETHTLSEWAKIQGIKRETISCRIRRYGWSVERALTEPVQKSKIAPEPEPGDP